VDLENGLADDQRLPPAEKKSLNDALPQILDNGSTTHPLLMQIALARTINQASGGAVIAPWEVDQLTEIWLDAFRFTTTALVQSQNAMQRVQGLKSAWLNKHPTYGKN
jgi:hypothetical protein